MSTTFQDLLKEIRGGTVVAELGEKLQELNRQVRATRKPGSITLKIDIKPVKKGGDTVTVEDTISVKMPNYEKEGSILFVTEDGELVRESPNQPKLKELREVPPRDVKVAAAGGNE